MSQENIVKWTEKKENISDDIIKLLDGLNSYQAKKIIEAVMSKIESVSVINLKY